MDFAQAQRRPSKHLIGFGFVILLHIFLVWAMASGLAQKVMKVIHKPITVKIEDQPPPPPPKDLPPPPPPAPNLPPPPIFVPQVEVQVTPPPATTAPQVATTNQAPAQFVQNTPAPPKDATPAPVAPPAPPSVRGLCNNAQEVGESMNDKFSVIADKEGITSATVDAQLVIGPGGEVRVGDMKGTSSLALKSLIRNSLPRLHCKGQGVDVATHYQIEFKLND